MSSTELCVTALPVVILYGHTSDITWVEFSGRLLATCSSDKTVRLWNATSPEERVVELKHSPLLGHRYTVHCCCFSPFGSVLATCSTDGFIYLWDVKTGERVAELQHPSQLAVRVCLFSPTTHRLATAGEDDSIVLWDVSTHTIIKTFDGHEGTVTCLSFTPDSSYIVSGSTNCDLKMWDAKLTHTKSLHSESEAHDLGVTGASFRPVTDEDSTYMLSSCGNDNEVKIWSVRTSPRCTFTLTHTLTGHTGNVMSCRFTADGKILASAAGDKGVRLWDPSTGSQLQKLERHARYVTSCTFTMDMEYLASGSNDKTVIIWKMFRGSEPQDDELDRERILKGVQAMCVNPLVDRDLSKNDPDLPDEFYCPITHEVMRDPVIAADGFTYERNAITEWFASGKDSSPLTNQQLVHINLIGNQTLRILIQRHKKK